jgi:hypothetical protein
VKQKRFNVEQIVTVLKQAEGEFRAWSWTAGEPNSTDWEYSQLLRH